METEESKMGILFLKTGDRLLGNIRKNETDGVYIKKPLRIVFYTDPVSESTGFKLLDYLPVELVKVEELSFPNIDIQHTIEPTKFLIECYDKIQAYAEETKNDPMRVRIKSVTKGDGEETYDGEDEEYLPMGEDLISGGNLSSKMVESILRALPRPKFVN